MSRSRNRRRRYPYGVLLDEPMRRVQPPTSLAERFAAQQAAEIPVAAPLTPWQHEKLRQAMQQALLLARWVVRR